jgi:TPR repeat protein
MTFNNAFRWLALPLVLAGMSAAVTASAAPRHPDAAAMWELFLAKRPVYKETLAAYDVLVSLGHDGAGVNAESCTEHAAAIRSAVDAVPVSIALRRIAYMCADASGDSALAATQAEALAALVRHAMQQVGDPATARPIKVVAPADAYALLQIRGLEEQYEYYSFTRPARYFPMVLVVWDKEARVERHLAFDYVDVLHRLDSQQQYDGMPIMREWIAEGFLESGRSLLAAADMRAVRAADSTNTRADKVAKLRGAAELGGMQAAKVWLLSCADEDAKAGCSDGLVAALLTQAEAKRAAPMALLAYAYLDGVGTKADAQAAWPLLDAAEKRWPGGALNEFADLWVTLHGDLPLPAGLRQRLDAAGDGAARVFRLQLEVQQDKPDLSKADIAFLAAPERNGRGLGYSVLDDYYTKLEDATQAWQWLVKAAEAGDAGSQAVYASTLIFGDEKAHVQPDAARGRKFAVEAAQGGDGWAARYMANEQVKAEDFKSAEAWLLGSANAGDIDSIMYLASLYAEERNGVSAGVDRGIELYRMLADLGQAGASARRALAEYALSGRGMAKDPAKALQWLRVDAEAGDDDSQLALGIHHLKGDFGKADEKEGVRWVDRAMKAGNEDAVTAYGSWLFYSKDTTESRAKALQLLRDAVAKGNVGASNNYAWILCTSPRSELYDPKRGMEVATQLGNIDALAAGTLDTVAACYAANGDFAKAVELQTRAARELAAYETPQGKRERGDKPAGYERRLKLYADGKRYQEIDQNE